LFASVHEEPEDDGEFGVADQFDRLKNDFSRIVGVFHGRKISLSFLFQKNLSNLSFLVVETFFKIFSKTAFLLLEIQTIQPVEGVTDKQVR
jgi:hypothetical protein